MQKLHALRYWIGGMLVGLGPVLFVAHEQHLAAEEYQHHRAKFCAALVGTVEQKETCVEERASAADYMPWGYVLVSWPEGITAWAIILTGFAIAWQSNETRKTANASADSVRMAQMSYEVTRNKEKPRITLSMLDYNLTAAEPDITYKVSFRCPTSAYIKSVKAAAKAVIAGSDQAPKAFPDAVGIPPTVDSNSAYTLRVRVYGEAELSRFSQRVYERMIDGEVDVIFVFHVLFEDAFGEREFMVSHVLQAGPLKNLNGSPFFMWVDGPKHLQRDK